MNPVKEAIFRTLAFYDIFQFPLTPFEILKNLASRAELSEIFAALAELNAENKILKKDGYFFLPQDKDLSAQRKARFLLSFKKLERAKKIARLFARFPFIRFVGVCNSLGVFNAADKSDIDFFIIARRGRLWSARFFTNLFLKIFNLRPARGNNKDKICLSFFVSDDGLDISQAALSEGDPYFYHWMGWILPLYDDGIYKKFIEANGWIKNHLPQFMAQDNYFSPRRRPIKWLFEKIIGGHLEKRLKNFQLGVMPKELKGAVSRGDNSVVMNDMMLKFHLLDRRAEYKGRYKEKIFNFK